MSPDPFASSRNARPLPPSSRRPDPVTLVWIGGVAIAALAYLVGPEHFLASVMAHVMNVGWLLNDAVRNLTATAFDAMRAAAIGLYGVFAALSVIAMSRGAPGRLGLVVVTLLFLWLVWGAWGDAPAVNARWLGALLLTAVAALSATRRIARR